MANQTDTPTEEYSSPRSPWDTRPLRLFTSVLSTRKRSDKYRRKCKQPVRGAFGADKHRASCGECGPQALASGTRAHGWQEFWGHAASVVHLLPAVCRLLLRLREVSDLPVGPNPRPTSGLPPRTCCACLPMPQALACADPTDPRGDPSRVGGGLRCPHLSRRTGLSLS